MQDHQPYELLSSHIDMFREWWKELTPEQRPPGLDIEKAFNYILDHTVLPELSYRIDQVLWLDLYNYGQNVFCACLPYLKRPDQGLTVWNCLQLHFTICPPKGTRKAWKIIVNYRSLQDLLDRFGMKSQMPLATELGNAMTSVPYRTGTGSRYRPYLSEEEAREAVGGVLLKLGLVRPLRDVEEMHEMTDYDS